jgi:hypothetical protein
MTAKHMQGMIVVLDPVVQSNCAAIDSFGHGQDVI